jgi:hypothetical protein
MNRNIITKAMVANSTGAIHHLQKKIDSNSKLNLNEDLHAKGALITRRMSTVGTAADILNEDLDVSNVQAAQAVRLEALKSEQSNVRNNAATESDTYATKLVKYIPTEVIAFYAALASIVASEKTTENLWLYTTGILVVGVVVTILYLRSVSKVDNAVQLFISCIAFLGWAISIDTNLEIPSTLKALLLPILTFIIPLLEPPTTIGNNPVLK